MSRSEEEAAARAHAVAQRAIRRLDMLEWVIFVGGAGLAIAGGAVIAGLLSTTTAWDFRSVWIGASFLLFIVPGTITVVRIRREERAHELHRRVKEEDRNG